MSKQNPCANYKLSGCDKIVVQRGVIFCDNCIEIRKINNKARREQSFEELVNINKELENEIQILRKSSYENDIEYKLKISKYEETISKLEESIKNHTDNTKYILYADQLEKENNRINQLLIKLRNDNEILLKERENYHTLYLQLNIDYQKLNLENIKLITLNESLKEQNQDLHTENEMLKK